MKALALNIENNGGMHSSLVNTLKAARFLPNLDAVEAFLKRAVKAHFWKVTRGGSHVALNYVTIAGSTRYAIITETDNADDVFEYAEVRAEMRRIEQDARRSDPDFLTDAPAGSGNLRTAMLEAAIRACAFQQPVYIDRKPVVTTGMSTTMLAALAVVELGALAVEVQS